MQQVAASICLRYGETVVVGIHSNTPVAVIIIDMFIWNSFYHTLDEERLTVNLNTPRDGIPFRFLCGYGAVNI